MKTSAVISCVLVSIACVNAWHGRIVFEDNFEGNTLDLNKWMYQEACDDIFGANNLQCYVRDNVAVQNGNLVITAKQQRMEDKDFTSGRIRQLGAGFTYGAFVVRARLARGDHLWPAIWLMGDETNACRYEEIDIAEYRGQASEYNRLEQAAHWGRAWYALTSKGEKVTGPADLSQGFHEYAVLWIPGKIEYYIDNVLYFQTSLTDPSWTSNPERIPCTGAPIPFNEPSRFILNVAVGGNFFDGFPPMNLNTWTKPTMEVDWVRIYQD
ncbi:hypothetical protein HA402_003565 [Bradysia odoriphaga]|nr:hypothetical protein HA402_003565 [Bradysia odoriphaga]